MRDLRLILVLALSFAPLALLEAAPAEPSETGQTTCYNAGGGIIADCTDTGQDGEHRAGVAWPVPRFVAGTGTEADCVTDELTGLMWMGAPDNNSGTWANALASVDGLALCGYSDWRLPNINELESLVNVEFANQATFLNAFSNVQADHYWSSSSYAFNAALAWVVLMLDGSVKSYNKSDIGYLWPVRGGQ